MRTPAWLVAIAVAAALVLVGVHGLDQSARLASGRAGPAAPLPRALAPSRLPTVLVKPAPAKAELPAGTKLARGLRRANGVALTFDDGPHPGYTRRILAILAAHQVRATFFVVGKMAAQYPELVAEEHAQGHLVADHGHNHVDMTRLSPSAARAEWARCAAVIRVITGEEVRFCRPPAGHYNRAVVAAAGDEGMSVILWSRYPDDCARPSASTIAARALSGVHGGDIILLHDGIEQTIEALPDIIAGLRARGLELQTIEQMAADVAAPPPPTQRQARDSTPRGVG
jgi:peptidoglycan/xylan/chitin deacetylase (PgdA/CDA1 family)